MRRRWLILLAAAVALVITRLLMHGLEQEQLSPRPIDPRLQYRIESMQLDVLDSSGNRQVRIRAPLLLDAGEGQPTRLRDPVVTAAHGGRQWRITAERARVDRDADRIVLERNVRVVVQQDNSPTELRTSRLIVEIGPRRIHSSEAVTITRPGLELSGRGLSADLEQETYELHHNVQALKTPR